MKQSLNHVLADSHTLLSLTHRAHWNVEGPGFFALPLRLRAGMKLPGRAWLEFEVVPEAGGRSVLSQTALFPPRAFSAGCSRTRSITYTP